MAVDDKINENLAEELEYNPYGGKCCRSCKNSESKRDIKIVKKNKYFSHYYRCNILKGTVPEIGYCKAYE